MALRPSEMTGMTPTPDSKRVTMDQMGKRILRRLASHVHVDVAAVAHELGAACEVVEARLAAMREAGVLQGFEPRLDLTRVDRPYEFLVTGSPSRGTDAQAIAQLSASGDVTRVFSLAATHSVAFTVVGRDAVATRRRGLELAQQAGLGQAQAVLVLNTFQDRPGSALVDALAAGPGLAEPAVAARRASATPPAAATQDGAATLVQVSAATSPLAGPLADPVAA